MNRYKQEEYKIIRNGLQNFITDQDFSWADFSLYWNLDILEVKIWRFYNLNVLYIPFFYKDINIELIR